LETGSYQAANSVCELAAQLHAGPAVDERLARSTRIRNLVSTVRTHASAQAWTAASASLKELQTHAPRITIHGVPSLEKITQYLAESLEKIRAVPIDTKPVEAARTCLALLRRWTDCDEAVQKISLICSRFESEHDVRRAAQLAGKLLELRPGDPAVKALHERVDLQAKVVETREAEHQTALREYRAALRENRLYAAERAFDAIEAAQATSSGSAQPGGDELRRRLAEIRRDLNEVKQRVSEPMCSERIIQRYLEILKQCRDCREALLALQTVPIDPPDPPEGLTVRREGNRRILSWRPGASGKRPSSYVVHRSMTRPGSRQGDAPFHVFYEGDADHVTDDEIAHGGVIVRYMVQAVARGRIEVEGTTVRTYEAASVPASFPGVLIWQEVINLRSHRRVRGLELTWFAPPGSRQVLIERWPQGPDDHGLGVAVLPATEDGRLVDDGLDEGTVQTYRISCLYDGPDGEFRTPGVRLTDGFVTGTSMPLDTPFHQDATISEGHAV
jgi:hypothetical protein